MHKIKNILSKIINKNKSLKIINKNKSLKLMNILNKIKIIYKEQEQIYQPISKLLVNILMK
jgi:hypothetical protein